MAKLEKYEELSNQILDLIGGKDNLTHFTHCITRLRFNVKDKGLVNKEEIEKKEGVVGVQWSGEQLQIIIGTNVEKVFQLIQKKHDLGTLVVDDSKTVIKEEKKNPIIRLLETISACVIPVLPILIGIGMVKVVIMLLSMVGVLASDSSTYQILTIVSDAGLYFLPVFVGASAAKRFGATESLGMLVGAMLIAPAFVANVANGVEMSFMGIPIYPGSYSSQIFPVILSVFVFSKIEKVCKKYLPPLFSSFLTPAICLLLITPLAFCLLAPLGAMLSTYLSMAIVWLYDTLGFFGVAIYAVLSPIMVMTGMHTGTTPYIMQSFTTLGYEPLLTVGGIISNINRGAACFGIALKTKKADLKGTAISAGTTAIVGGITEPALFGVLIPNKTAFAGCLIGSFVGGLIAGLAKVSMFAFAGSMGIFGIPCFTNIPFLILAMVVSAVVSIISTYVLYKD